MSSGIEVFFTEVNKPWSNADPGSYHVNVFSPDGAELIGVPAPDGHALIDLPPGRYLVVGTLSGIYVNFDSNETIVNVGCNQRVCVTVIPRSLHFCVWWLTAALQLIDENAHLAPAVAQLAKPALQALNAIERQIPEQFRQLPFLPEALQPVRKELEKGRNDRGYESTPEDSNRQ